MNGTITTQNKKGDVFTISFSSIKHLNILVNYYTIDSKNENNF